MKICIVGAGNIATFFSNKFYSHGQEIVQVISQTEGSARTLAANYNAAFSANIQDLHPDSEVVLLAVKDDVVASMLTHQNLFTGKILIHTAGSLTIQDISIASDKAGSIWCMYSINKNHLPQRDNIPLIINASNQFALSKVQELAKCISENIFQLNDEQKLKAHLAAVFANNFANHLFTIGQDILARENISFELLIPLIENTVEKLLYSSPDKLQTGPAIRHDAQTIAKHELLLQELGDYKEIYALLTRSIQRKYTE